jgi:hypothetical protein
MKTLIAINMLVPVTNEHGIQEVFPAVANGPITTTTIV